MPEEELDEVTIRAIIKTMKVQKQLNNLEGGLKISEKEKQAFIKLLKKEGKEFSKIAKGELKGFANEFMDFFMP